MERAMTMVDDSAPPIINAILNRQSATRYREECPPQAVIRQLLDVAVTAPNHHLNQPWRFVVLAGEERARFGDFLAERLAHKLDDPNSAQSRMLLEAERRKPLHAPVLIVVAAVRTDHPKALRIEDVASTAAAVQNIILAAPTFGLVAFWRTGKSAEDPRVMEFFGLSEADDIVAFLYIGYPDRVRAMHPRAPASKHTTWCGWSE